MIVTPWSYWPTAPPAIRPHHKSSRSSIQAQEVAPEGDGRPSGGAEIVPRIPRRRPTRTDAAQGRLVRRGTSPPARFGPRGLTSSRFASPSGRWALPFRERPSARSGAPTIDTPGAPPRCRPISAAPGADAPRARRPPARAGQGGSPDAGHDHVLRVARTPRGLGVGPSRDGSRLRARAGEGVDEGSPAMGGVRGAGLVDA